MSRHPRTMLVGAVTGVAALLVGLLTAAPASATPASTGATSTTPVVGQATDATQAAVQPGTFRGRGFDTCNAPTAAQMKAWLASPYRAIGVYIGGVNRSCQQQPNLTASWARTVAAQGWHLLPLYVGLQAPCMTRHSTSIKKISTTLATARRQGRNAATTAAEKMANLGLAPGNPVYYDMENYDPSKTRCVRAVRAFTNAWTVTLQNKGYRSGIYGSTSSMMADLVRWYTQDTYHRPDDIWYARWDGKASTTGDPAIPDQYWSKHQRVHQYRGNVWQWHGGVRLNIDQNQVDAHTTRAPMSIYAGVPHAQLDHAYRHRLTTAGGAGPFRWAVTSGSLPDGLSLTRAGVIRGTPTAVGRSTATVRVTDSKGRTATGTIRLTVDFADVPPGAQFYSDVMWLARQGITTGYSDGTFRPKLAVSRQAMAAFLFRYDTDATAQACTSRPFSDVRVRDTFCPQITWLKGSGITTGYPDGTFRPKLAVSRQAMAAYLSRMVNGSADPPKCTRPRTFWDVPLRYQFCPEITWLASTGVTQGYPDPGHSLPGYHPTTPVSRQAMAAFLHRLAAAT